VDGIEVAGELGEVSPASAPMGPKASSRTASGTSGRGFFWPSPFCSGTNARSSQASASGARAVPVRMRVVTIARRPSSSMDSTRALQCSGSPATSGVRSTMRQPALSTRTSG
jgi:hypothetical protein